jgi:phosphoribosylcarboxyaminoimidazole (NCAIR) mutase
MALLTRAIAKIPVHLVLGSTSDAGIGRRVLAALDEWGVKDVAVHILSCHRNPADVRTFAEEFAGKAVVCVGGMSFQLPAVLDSWFREFYNPVAVLGIPVGDTPERLEPAVSAMRDLPSPCEVHWASDNSDSSICGIAEQVAVLLDGRPPDGVAEAGWSERLRKHRERLPQTNVDLEEV